MRRSSIQARQARQQDCYFASGEAVSTYLHLSVEADVYLVGLGIRYEADMICILILLTIQCIKDTYTATNLI